MLALPKASRDRNAVKALDADPLIAHESQSTRTVSALASVDGRLKQSFNKITLSVFIIHGAADKATKFQGSQCFHGHAGSL